MATYDPDAYAKAAAARKKAAAARDKALADIQTVMPVLREQIPLAVAAGRKPADIVRETGLDKEEVRRIRKGLNRLGQPAAESGQVGDTT